MNPKDLITEIRTVEYHLDTDGTPKSGVENLLSKINRMSEQLSEGLYERTDHFIFELIQNAEDNSYAQNVTPRIKFHLLQDDPTNTPGSNGCLCVFNNEQGFAQDNVRAICDFNNSTKKGKKSEGFIGEKGLGFKSVFMVTNSPHIYSNGYQFKFLRHDPVATVGYVVPYWLDDVLKVVAVESDSTTAILLPLRDDNYQFIKEQLEAFSPQSLLFLKKLHAIEIITEDIEKIVECKKQGKHVVLSHLLNDEITEQRFWLESESFEVPSDINEDKREGVLHSEVTVALPLDGVTGDERIFAYLPTEERPGLPFYVNADFLLPSSRESILKNKTWNTWLVSNIGQVAAKAILSLANNSTDNFNAYRYIPLTNELAGGASNFAAVCNDVQAILADTKSVITDDGFQYPVLCLEVSSNLRFLLDTKKPEYFDVGYLIHEEITKDALKLKSIGVSAANSDDVL